jgi:hypothetical protein
VSDSAAAALQIECRGDDRRCLSEGDRVAEFEFPPLWRDVGILQELSTEDQTAAARTLAITVPNGKQRFPVPDEDSGPAKRLLIAAGALRFGQDGEGWDPTSEINEEAEVDENTPRTLNLRLRVGKQLGVEPMVTATAFGGLGTMFVPIDVNSGAATDDAGVRRDQSPDEPGWEAWYLSDVRAWGKVGDEQLGQLFRMGYPASLLVETPLSGKRERQHRQSTTAPIATS